jgi:glycosyltransferase involved in cell wall biosynthesis
MACEAPVVASAVGGIVEVVVDGETGLLVPPARPDDLAREILALLRDPSRARAMGIAGRRRVEALFTWDRIAERTAKVYADALEDFARRRDRTSAASRT